jgi:hypothetical protein
MTTQDLFNMAQEMENDGCVHGLMLAIALGSLSPVFGADLVKEVNSGGMSWDEVILALYFAVYAAPDLFPK